MALTIGDYLRTWRKWRKESQYVVWKRGKELIPKLSKHAILRYEMGKEKIDRDSVDFVARMYKTDTAVLLSFLQDGHERILRLRPTSFQGTHLVAEPPTGAPGHEGAIHKATYRLAPNRLAQSDMMLAFIEFGPGGHTRKDGHRHPGEEIMKVEAGKVTVVSHNSLGEPERQILEAGDILHFESEYEHYVENASDVEPASVLVIRELHAEAKGFQKPTQRRSRTRRRRGESPSPSRE